MCWWRFLPLLAAWIVDRVSCVQVAVSSRAPLVSQHANKDLPFKSLFEKWGNPKRLSVLATRTKLVDPKKMRPWPEQKTKMPGDFDDWQSWSEMITLRNKKFVFCAQPKSASTVWKQLLLRASGVKHWNTTNSTMIHHPVFSGLQLVGVKHGQHTKDVKGHNESDILEVINRGEGVTKAAMVRDPVTRILSSYLDRCVDNFEWLRCYATKWVPFEQVITNIENERKAGRVVVDVHFKNETHMCGLRHMNYTLVGHYEYFHDDSRFILQAAGLWDEFGKKGWGPQGRSSFAVETQRMSNHIKEHATAKLVCKHYTPQLLKRVRDLYKPDFDMFGYDIQVWRKRCRNDWIEQGKIKKKPNKKQPSQQGAATQPAQKKPKRKP